MSDQTTIVFLGDSITAASDGYTRIATDLARALRPEEPLRTINAGVGGNRSVDLPARLDRDVLAHRPDIVTVSIGINDVWRSLDSPRLGVRLHDYQAAVATVLDRIAAVDARAVVLTTSVIGEQLDSEGNRRLVPYNVALHALAQERGLVVADVNAAFQRAMAASHLPALTTDGVHLTHLGNTIMALAVLRGLDYTLP
ncbi:MAG TPA: SGNH/GDSL hydrolase family protein [Chloroflexota bacterium]|nr:SGNH/GDSL hydrolase family protein [Chloroflexota bacterium]